MGEDNRRSEPRFEVNSLVEVMLRYPTAGGPYHGQVTDLSKNGLHIVLDTSLPKGGHVQVKFGDVVVLGEVRFCNELGEDRFEAGLHIEDFFTRS